MLIVVVSGVVLGTMLQVQQRDLWEAAWYVAYGLSAFAGLVGIGLWRGRSVWSQGASFDKLRTNTRLVLGFGLSVVLAFSLTGYRATVFLQTAMNPALEGKDLEVVGVVSAMPQRLETGLRFRLEVDSAHTEQGQPVTLPPRIQLAWYNANFADDGFALADGQSTPAAGERWQFTVRLKAPHGNSNPHGFDYELWLWEQGVQATGYVRVNRKQTPPRKLTAGSLQPRYVIERARQSVRDAVFKTLDQSKSAGQSTRNNAGVVAALITGDQNAIERADWDIFRATGVAHLMSISGLHITMFAWGAALLLGWAWRKTARRSQRLCLWLPSVHAGLLGGLALAALYAWFSGWGVPAQRTIWMLLTFTLLRLSGLKWPWWMTWLLAMFVVVLADPWACLQAGFWLSFVAVAVLFASDNQQTVRTELVVVRGADRSSLDKLRTNGLFKRAFLLMREQWLITLALAPLTLVLFQQVSLVGLIANAIAIPVVTLVVTPLAFLGVLFSPLWSAAAWVLSFMHVMLTGLAALPLATWQLPATPQPLGIAAVFGGIALAVPIVKLKLWMRLLTALLLIAPMLLWREAPIAYGDFKLLAADIGQGNAVLVQTTNHSLLYDAGPRFSRESDAGHRTLVPLLRALGAQLDVLMLSHKDSDHTGGAASVWQSSMQRSPDAFVISSMASPAERSGIGLPEYVPHKPCTAGLAWQWDGVKFELMHPTEQQSSDSLARKIKPNALSCVLKITATNGESALLVGDIEAQQETALVSGGAALESTLLLVPHHGSKTSSTEAFLDAVKPKLAVVQAGYKNRFSHPVPQVMARYDERQIKVLDTPRCGAVHWSSDEPTSGQCQRDVATRYWHHKFN